MLPAGLGDTDTGLHIPASVQPRPQEQPQQQQQQQPPPLVPAGPEKFVRKAGVQLAPAGKFTATLEGVHASLTSFLQELHAKYATLPPGPKPMAIWDMYKETADKWLLPLDRDHIGTGLFPLKEDDSIFVSSASYRDEYCVSTLRDMYAKADHPEKVFVGLVQQNCVENCRTGVLEGGKVEDTEPDEDCYKVFCASPEGQGRCGPQGPVRQLFVNESESLGPAVARYFASKLWFGENFFMQIDSHSKFDQGWDTVAVEDIRKTPSYPKSALTHYPPDQGSPQYNQPAHRICGATFAESDIENQIIRLANCDGWDKQVQDVPCPAPFIGAGYVFAHASFLAVAPFDPYVPWVFMGEEVQFSLRLYTWGYDMYSPTRNKVSHYYVRKHKPKFWETVGRLFQKPGIHNSIQSLLIDRVKNLVAYPESSSEIVAPSLIDHMDLYGEGPVRSLEEFLSITGLDTTGKVAHKIDWCYNCEAPRPVIDVTL